MAHLFAPFTLRSMTLGNRIVMAPMCMYVAGPDGLATDWHLAHYLTRAVGGAGLIIAEATAVEPRGRISANDLGLWNDSQIEPMARIARAVKAEGAAIGVQLAHAGRKAFTADKGFGPQAIVAPCAVPFDAGYRTPVELSEAEIDAVLASWRSAALRAHSAGFDLVEIHGAHGYLNHQFLSPLANRRADGYGGPLINRMRFLLRVVEAVRETWPPEKPLFVRVSVTDWVEGGITPDDVVVVARELRERAVDLVHCSSGGVVPLSPSSVGPGYQVPFAEKVRREAGIPTAAVGLITAPEHADVIVREGQADLVALGRELLRSPYWPLSAARALGHDLPWPKPYERARPR